MLYFSDISNTNVSKHDISIDDSPSRLEWDEKIVQAAGEFTSNSHDPRKTRSKTSRASFAIDSALVDHYYMLIGYYP